MAPTQKETVEYNERFLQEWNLFCDSKGYVKRQASHACRIALMQMSDEDVERAMRQAAEVLNGNHAPKQPE